MPVNLHPSDRAVQRLPRTAGDHRPWSWKLGTIAGVPIYIHATFVLLLAWVALSHLGARHQLALAVYGLVLVASVFAIVVAHELGHVLVARRFGIPTHDITLYPIGGMSRLDHMPERPRRELLVAIAGPAVNVVLALAIYVALDLSGAGAAGDPLTVGGGFAVQLLWINLSLAAFNLLPAFPMDGGRVLRAALALWMPRDRATIVASHVARMLAVGIGVAGVLWSPLLAVIAIFVWMAAGQEARVERMKAALRGVSVGDAMVAQIDTLDPHTSLAIAARSALVGFQREFPVVDGARVVGVLTHGDVLRGLAMHRAELTVGDVMHDRFAVAAPDEGLATVLSRTLPGGSSVLVVDHDRLVGMLDPEHVSRLVAAHAAQQPGA